MMPSPSKNFHCFASNQSLRNDQTIRMGEPETPARPFLSWFKSSSGWTHVHSAKRSVPSQAIIKAQQAHR